jgi:uncharacterized protein YgiM (DUF1202 family)
MKKSNSSCKVRRQLEAPDASPSPMEGRAPSRPPEIRSRRSVALQPAFCAVLVCAALGLVAPSTRGDVIETVQPVATSPAVADTGSHGTVKASRCNVRSRPSLNAEVVAQLHKGDAVDVLERKTVTEHEKPMEWLRIALPATAKCFVSSKLLTDGAVNVDSLYVRCGPGTNYRDIGKLAKGTKVDAVETTGEWTQIKPTTQCNGWIAGELVGVEPVAAPVVTPPPTASLNTPEVVTPPVAVPRTAVAAPAALPAVSIVNIDPDVQVQYVVKDGYLRVVTESGAPASYELRTAEVDRLSHRVAFLETSETNLKKYVGRQVRVTGNQRWRKGDRDPVIVVERIDIVW